jgi:hypothetical protein
MVLKRLEPFSLAKISGALYVAVGLIIGACFSLISILGLATTPDDAPAHLSLFFGVGAIVWAPLLYGLMGFVGALIMAGLYNWMARMVGGVQLELE